MIRLNLVQMFYNPAYYDFQYDYLEEPCFLHDMGSPLGRLRTLSAVEDFLLDSKSSYIDYLRSKVLDIISSSGSHKSNILVFPEYSIPFQILPEIREMAKQYSMIIIAGTHRVPSGSNANSVYQELGLNPDLLPLGSACAPIFLPDGSTRIALKLKKSKWEPNLNTPLEDPGVIEGEFEGEKIRIAVIPCVDSLHSEVIGKLFANRTTTPDIIFCPSQSPVIDPFIVIGMEVALRERIFAYVNTSSFGGTSFNLPSKWDPYLTGIPPICKTLPQGSEAILEIDVNLKSFFLKKGSIEDGNPGAHPKLFPIVYAQNNTWVSKYEKLGKDICELLQIPDIETATEWLDSYLTEEASNLPVLVLQNLKHLRHCILPLYDGNLEPLRDSLDIVRIRENISDTELIWANRVNKAISLLTKLFPEAPTNLTDAILYSLKTLKAQKESLPRVFLPPFEKIDTEMPTKSPGPAFVGEENLVEAFQNRGGDLDTIRNFFANHENRVILITGPVGIGKTDFINWMFRKQFSDWQIIRVPIARESRFPRLLADVGYKLGISLDIDSLATTSSSVLRQKIIKVLGQFYSCPKRALIIDDLHDILKKGSSRDYNQLSIFVELAAAPAQFQGGRMFLVSSQWLPDSWIHRKGVAHLALKGLMDLYARRIIEFQMRRLHLVESEAIPEPPQALLDIARGHPLSARLIVENLRTRDLKQLGDELMLREITGQVAKELLSRMQMTEKEEMLMRKLSIFRLPVQLDILSRIEEFDEDRPEMIKLASRCILSFDGKSFAMHEAVRRYFESQISPEDIGDFQKLAALYYSKIYEMQRFGPVRDPSIIAELVHHLSLSKETPELKDFRLFMIEEIKPAARKIYREYRDYEKALAIYRLVSHIVPDDAEVFAYIGRCYARLGLWEDSDKAFEHAIGLARRRKAPFWWLYRDWGHIRARYMFYREAFEHFENASMVKPEDPSIKASLGYIHWQQGDYKQAREFFEEAITFNPYHEYTLTYYPKFLESTGLKEDAEYASKLRKRLAELESGAFYSPPAEYDIDFEYDV